MDVAQNSGPKRDAEEARRPSRPLLAAAAAAVLGSWCGAHDAARAVPLHACAAFAAALALAALLSLARHGSARARVLRWTWLVLIALGFALRAQSVGRAAPPEERATTVEAVSVDATVDAAPRDVERVGARREELQRSDRERDDLRQEEDVQHDDESLDAEWLDVPARDEAHAAHDAAHDEIDATTSARAPDDDAWIGVWRDDGGFEPQRRGRLEPLGRRIELEGRLADDGETLALRPVRPTPLLPRGPLAGPRAESGREAPLELLPDELVRVAPPDANVATAIAERARALRTVLLVRVQSLPHERARGLIAALLFGDTSALPRGAHDLFVRTGTYHLLAVSGLQIALGAVFLIVPLARLCAFLVRIASRGRIEISEGVVRLALLALYVLLAGSQPPVVRSGITCALIWLVPRLSVARAAHVRVLPALDARARGTAASSAHATRRVRLTQRVDGFSLWALALVCECIRDPAAPSSLSVQLSYAATAGLILGTAPLTALVRAHTRWLVPSAVDGLGRARAWWWRVPLVRVGGGLTAGIGASLAAVLATLPFTWWKLGEWSPVGIVATCALFVPLAVLLIGGWIWVLVPALAQVSFSSTPLAWCADLSFAALHVFDALPATPQPLPTRPFAWIAFAVVCAFVALRAHAPKRRRWAARVAAFGFGLAFLPWTTAPQALRYDLCDVGAGTASVLSAPGLGTWVFDAGSRDRADVAREALGPLLRALDPARLGVVLSHSDRDHDAGLAWLVERYPPEVWAGAAPARSTERLPHTTRRIDLARGAVRLPALHVDSIGELWLERGLDVPGNEGSRLLRVRFGGRELLLCGDAEEAGLAAWLAESARAKKAAPTRLLLWPHHGSEMELCEPLLALTQPAEVWFSCVGRGAIADELDRRGIAWRSTGVHGPQSLSIAWERVDDARDADGTPLALQAAPTPGGAR